ncbi:hypothetical protein BJ322DRAFT_154931 [Thelephora terrestris]|uniref:F-box domain-containing protein n=1 Tax=Thelephora terrestris TaxID=56493 RepID=A0A9P6HDN3_9AGAM|nr:hypothetical protein BJ322DRAFT_154931 [Thelephora terrestris]
MHRPPPSAFTASMSSQTHPGKGLSPPQLVFALNEALKHTAYSSLVTSDQVSQLHQDTLTAFTAISEWKNSFALINRVPLDILSLIPTHLCTQKDRFRSSFVCRHWRRTFLQRAELWSELHLSKGEDYVKTLLGRAKGSALDVIVGPGVSASITTLLSSRTEQFRSLCFEDNGSEDIKMFLEANYGPLPLLRTLDIFTDEIDPVINPPSALLLNRATDLKEFSFCSTSKWFPSLDCFAFPNLTSFDLSANPHNRTLRGAQLLDFLEASPMLQVVRMEIHADIQLEDVPQDRVVTLPNVDNFSLTVIIRGSVYGFAAHVSCPSASSTNLVYSANTKRFKEEKIFPPSNLWRRIVGQYTRSPLEEVALEIKGVPVTACKLAFRSSDGSVLKLGFKSAAFIEHWPDEREDEPTHGPIFDKAFGDATRIILDHPQVADVRRLHIHHRFGPSG